MKYLLLRDATIVGHRCTTYFTKNQNGKGSFVLFGESSAHRFNTVMDAYTMMHQIAQEKGYLIENMKVIESNSDATMVMPV